MEKLLDKVRKPGRYLGNEWNARKKHHDSVDVKVALCFPDIYEIGMSHLGFRIIYSILNQRSDSLCERAFAPAVDAEAQMRQDGIPLFSLETKTPLPEFDIVGFSLSYELSYTNFLNMLDLAGIPVLSKDRSQRHPLVIAGGFCCFNPQPLVDFVDLFIIGEAEEAIEEIVEAYKDAKKQGFGRQEIIKKLSDVESVYAPSCHDGAKAIKKRILPELDKSRIHKDDYLVPHVEIVHDRISVEIMRGCPFRCRFCQAQAVYRPKREKSKDEIINSVRQIYSTTGYEDISLVSLSSGTHSKIGELIQGLKQSIGSKDVSISLPSLRVESALEELPRMLNERRRTGLTFAPEAGTQRLRKVINKSIDIEQLVQCISQALEMGWRGAKLYFMIGLPTEAREDLQGIVSIINRVAAMKTKDGRRCQLTVSVSSFIPKPHTPFQWEAMDKVDTLLEKQSFIRRAIGQRNVKLDFHDPKVSFLEATLCRGDKRLSKVIYEAWRKGAKFDGWQEHFKLDVWMSSFSEQGIEPAEYANRQRQPDEKLPWDFIEMGISKKELLDERQEALIGGEI